jgi:CheY-like chemotaxis protein
MVLQRVLETFGFRHIALAEDGAEAAACFTPGTFDVIFMDCQMPNMDGYEATRRIRAHEAEAQSPHQTLVVAMTANVMSGERELCYKAGMNDYFTKPVDVVRLREMLGRYFIFANDDAEVDPTSTLAFKQSSTGNVLMHDDDRAELLSVFFVRSEAQLRTLDSALQEQRTDAWQAIGHYLKGSGLALGLERFAELCRQIEHGTPTDEGSAELLQAAWDEFRTLRSSAIAA